jgi:hypothetical protein
MLTPDQINELHRLHLVEKWSLRKISRHLRIGFRAPAGISVLSLCARLNIRDDSNCCGTNPTVLRKVNIRLFPH